MTTASLSASILETLAAFKGRSFLKLSDFGPTDIQALLEFSGRLKADKAQGQESPRLHGKNIALIFEKTSTRTRCAFEVAAYDQGAHVTYLGPTGSQIGHKESIADTARVLGRMYDAIEYRGFEQERVEILGEYAGVPVYNGLTTEFHPTQILADLLTINEHVEAPLSEVTLCYCGDGANNMAHSLMIGGALMGVDVRIAAPAGHHPDASITKQAQTLAATHGGTVTVTEDPTQGVEGADVVYTDVWVSMGEPPEAWDQKIKKMLPYQVNEALMKQTGKEHSIFLHCLPAFHDQKTKIGAELGARYGLSGLEVSDAVFESQASKVFDQAENRMHTIKAVMVATLNPPGM